MGWWYYASGVEKALVVVGVIAIALLAVILASPYVKPLQFITTKLGLVQEKVVYIPVPVNHTVYINKTIIKYVYVNQTVPVYINKTIYVTVPNSTSSIPPMFNMGTCHLYSLVFSNGTVWTLGYWIPTPQAWGMLNGTLIIWGRLNGTAGYQKVTEFSALAISYPMEGSIFLPLIINIPYNTPPGWVGMVYMGDWAGIGPIIVTSGKIEGNTLVILSLRLEVPSLAIPFNTTVTVIIVPYPGYVVPILIPCNWTVIKTPLTPEQALALPAPMGELFISEAWYITYGNYNYPMTHTTWGYLEWRVNVQPMNVTNLPWPLS